MLCLACQIHKPEAQFYKNARMTSGYLNQCKECVRTRVRAKRKIDVEQYRARDNARNMRPDRVAARRVFIKTEAGRTSKKKTMQKWVASNDEKRKAHIIVGNAVRSSKLVKETCYKCDSTEVQAHHEDYDKPLDVLWCCAKHHKELHK